MAALPLSLICDSALDELMNDGMDYCLFANATDPLTDEQHQNQTAIEERSSGSRYNADQHTYGCESIIKRCTYLLVQ